MHQIDLTLSSHSKHHLSKYSVTRMAQIVSVTKAVQIIESIVYYSNLDTMETFQICYTFH